MPTDQNQALSDGITFQTAAPIDWRKLQSFPADGPQSQNSTANLRLLNALNTLEELPPDMEKSVQGLAEFSHLEAKLDIMLGMLGELLQQQAKLPEALQMTVAANGLSIEVIPAVKLPVVGDLLRVRLFLDTHYPQALILFGTVSSVTKSGFTLGFHALGELVQEQLDKFIFRQHRRAIALSRRELKT